MMSKNTFYNLCLITSVFFVLEFCLRIIDVTDRNSDEVVTSINSNLLTFKDYTPNSSFKRAESKIDNIEEIEIQVNSFGIRGPEITDKKHKRYINIGDSFIQSDEINFNQTFSELLNNQFKDSIQFIAHGISSWSPTPIFSWLYHKGVSLNPDKVNLFLCINDFYRPEVYSGSDSIYRKHAIYNEGIPIKYQLNKKNTLKKVLGNIELIRLPYLVYKNIKRSRVAPNLNKYEPINQEILLLEKNYKIWPEDLKYNVDQTLKVISNINTFLKSKNINFEVYVIPLGYMWKDECEEARRVFKIKKHKIITPKGFEQYLFENLNDKFGIKTHNLSIEFNEFKENNFQSQLYFTYDGHWNEKGHELLSQIITKKIKWKY